MKNIIFMLVKYLLVSVLLVFISCSKNEKKEEIPRLQPALPPGSVEVVAEIVGADSLNNLFQIKINKIKRSGGSKLLTVDDTININLTETQREMINNKNIDSLRLLLKSFETIGESNSKWQILKIK